MKYDYIMCMMVDDSVKTKDGLDDPEKNAGYEMKKEGQYFKIYKNGKLIAMKSTEEEARREASRHRAANDSDNKSIDKAIRSCDRVTVKYDDAIGDTHTFFKESEEEAKKWIDQGKFPHGAAFNIKIDGKLYKKEAR